MRCLFQKHKARLVARGFLQKTGMDYFEVYAPVASISSRCEVCILEWSIR
ncbi:putative reverse transcriptase, RNA-dependent DNA polymerase [Medicago truncatula]|uniref:Putative reverse transcriptase, RNA-dependent DNA polymerase n=1 Tax=Medicago truncatula TaxID=3880 RepID=A0A396HS00_MEDTR|nr:putative reverse transcriptase, RNA-dependent DNA polymerase [Medicago truncatula]